MSAVGNYDKIPTVVTMIGSPCISKIADKIVRTDGLFSYTVTITNNTPKEYSGSGPVVQDIFDILLIGFIDSSVTKDGIVMEVYIYSIDADLLTINLDKIEASLSKRNSLIKNHIFSYFFILLKPKLLCFHIPYYY